MSHWRYVLSSTRAPAAPCSWGWDWCKTPLRVPQAHQGVSPRVCVSPQAGHRWLVVAHGKVAIIAGQLLAVPHQALLHKIFLHPCLSGKKIHSVLCFFSSWSFLWLKSLKANAWLLVNLAGDHLSPSSTSLFKYLSWLAFRSLGLGFFKIPKPQLMISSVWIF